MPSVDKTDRSTIRKNVEFVAKDEEEQIATGIVMVPWAVDLQGDWERPETIQEFAEQFADFEEVGQAGGGVMHAVFPDSHLELVENTVLESSQEIGGKEVPAGAWQQDWKFHDGQLWGLVGDVLEGYSIGADAVRWNGPMHQDGLPEEVSVPDEIPEDEPVWELTEGIIREVSTVDIPAVPDAQILETKDAYEKRLADHLGNRDGFIEEAMERGHSEEDAERLWEYLNRAADIEGAGEPGEKSRFASIGRTVVDAVFGSDDGGRAKTPPEAQETAKEGRTLSTANRDSLFASIDAGLDVLEDAGVDHGMTRFTDRDDVEFDLTEHSARAWSNPGDHPEDEEEEEDAGDPPDDGEDEGEDEDEEGEETENAAGGDTPDDTETMSDTNGGEGGEEKTLAEKNAEQIGKLSETVEDIADAVTGGEEKTVTLEIGGEAIEVTESEAKAWFEDGEAPESDPMDDAPEYVRALDEKVESVNERIERINQQSGTSQQIDPAAEKNGAEETSGLDAVAKLLD